MSATTCPHCGEAPFDGTVTMMVAHIALDCPEWSSDSEQED